MDNKQHETIDQKSAESQNNNPMFQPEKPKKHILAKTISALFILLIGGMLSTALRYAGVYGGLIVFGLVAGEIFLIRAIWHAIDGEDDGTNNNHEQHVEDDPKFCRVCCTELNPGSSVCPKCGAMAIKSMKQNNDSNAVKEEKETEKPDSVSKNVEDDHTLYDRKKLIAVIFTFVIVVLIIVGIPIAINMINNKQVNTRSNSSSHNQTVDNDSGNTISDFQLKQEPSES